MMPVHESTLALSVYSALTRAGSMTLEQTLAHLQTHWAPQMVESEVLEGVGYLEVRGFVVTDGDMLHVCHVRGGVARPLARKRGAPTELILA